MANKYLHPEDGKFYPDVDGKGSILITEIDEHIRFSTHFIGDPERICLFCSDWTSRKARKERVGGKYSDHTLRPTVNETVNLVNAVKLDKNNRCPECERNYSAEVLDILPPNRGRVSKREKQESQELSETLV